MNIETGNSKAVYELFPVPIIKFKFNKQLTIKELNYVHEQPTHKNQGNSISNNLYVLKDRKLAAIRTFIETCLDEYVNEVYAPIEKFNLEITQSWLNYTKPSEYHHLHKHSNSLVSGVFYVSADSTTDKIYFHSPQLETWITVPSINYNKFNSNSWWFTVETGDLILFPSFVPHRVDIVTGEKERVSLSFNTFVVGTLGVSTEPNRLTISGVA